MNVKPNDATIRYIDACFSIMTTNGQIPEAEVLDKNMDAMLLWNGGAIIRR